MLLSAMYVLNYLSIFLTCTKSMHKSKYAFHEANFKPDLIMHPQPQSVLMEVPWNSSNSLR